MPDRNIPVKHDHAPRPLDRCGFQVDNGCMKELARIRRKRGLTQQQLADKAGMDQGTISKIERDPAYNYTADTIAKLAAALNVEPAELFGLSELQSRVVEALRAIADPERQRAAILVLESMAASKNR